MKNNVIINITKSCCLYAIVFLIGVNGNAQVVTNPSTQPGYDSAKAALVSPNPSTGNSASGLVVSEAQTASSSCFINTDASYTSFAANDDGSLGPINLGFSFNFYGTNYTQLWINNNGNVTFSGAFGTFSSTGFPNNTPMIAAFWADVDTRNAASAVVKYKLSTGKIIVTWQGVGYYYNAADKLNWFQIIITDGTDPSIGLGNNVAFNYGDMQWTTGDASGGVGGFGGTPATVGINKGDGTNYLQVGRFGLNSSAYDGGGGATDGVNYLDYECFRFNVSSVTNQAPSVSGVPAGNVVNLRCGSSQNITLTFLPPEVNQTVTTTINTGGMCNTTTSIVNGTTSTATVNITAATCNIGANTLTFTATDNFNPAATTTVTITVNVVADTTAIITNSPLCVGNTLNLSATNAGSGASYAWTGPNSFTSTNVSPSISNIQTNQAGTYNVTVTRANGCVSTASNNVVVNELPTVNAITGSTVVLVSQTTPLSNTTVGGTWSSSNTTVATISNSGIITALQTGTTTITYSVTNANGCTNSVTYTVTVTAFVNP